MGLIPRLPETAPFSSSQRAWLNGYLTGLFSLEAGGDGLQSPPPVTAPSKGEDLPWHDPILPLEERLLLAQGKPPEQVLMAAMAQTDCGQCGYLCRTYAQAIARGEEKSLSRCVPGGQATSRKLKELVGGDEPAIEVIAQFDPVPMIEGANGTVDVTPVVLAPAPKPMTPARPTSRWMLGFAKPVLSTTPNPKRTRATLFWRSTLRYRNTRSATASAWLLATPPN